MAHIGGDNECCGLREIGGLSEGDTPEEQMVQLVRDIYGIEVQKKSEKPKKIKWLTEFGEKYYIGPLGYRIYKDDLDYGADDGYGDQKWRYAVFTQAGKRESYGRKFAAYIVKHKLGEVAQATTKTVRNPNTGNILKAWLWTVNHKALKAWAKKGI